MKEFEFLRELRKNLEHKIPDEELKDILSDYEAFFASGREEGKTDDEISNDLGSPAFLAKQLLEDRDCANQKKGVPPVGKFANPGKRLCAYMLDAVIAVMPIALIALVLFRNILMPGLMAVSYPSPASGTFVSLAFYQFAGPSPGVVSSYTVGPNGIVYSTGISNAARHSSYTVKRIIAFSALAFYLLYSLVCSMILKGQTIGKKIMKIKIQNLNEKPATRGAIFYREFIGKTLLNSIPIVPLISFIAMLITNEHKTLHDMIADTVVVDA